MKSAAVSKLKATLSEYLARAGLVRLGSGKLPKGFWKMPRPADPTGAGVKAVLEERETGR